MTICSRMARWGSSTPPIITMVSSRPRSSRGELACTVVMEPGVAGVHGLEHVQGLGATALTDDDAVGPHTQGVADEVADADLAAALGVGRPGLQRDDVGSLDLEFGRLLDRDEPLAVRDEVRQDVQHRGLPGAGSADDDDADLAAHQRLEEHRGVHAERPEPDQVLHDQGLARGTSGW